MKHLDMSNAIASAPANTRQVSNSAILTTERSYSEVATDNGKCNRYLDREYLTRTTEAIRMGQPEY